MAQQTMCSFPLSYYYIHPGYVAPLQYHPEYINTVITAMPPQGREIPKIIPETPSYSATPKITPTPTVVMPEIRVIPTVPELILPTNDSEYGFDIAKDCKTLNIAFDGTGCDKIAISKVLSHRTCIQREQIQIVYQNKYKENLISRVSSEVMEPLRRLLLSLLYTRSDLDAYLLNPTLKFQLDCDAIRYILSSRSSEQIAMIQRSYQKIFNISLRSHIESELKGDFQKLLIAILENCRDSSSLLDEQKATEDANQLKIHCKSIIKPPVDSIDIFTTRNYEQLQLIFQKYGQIRGSTINGHLKRFYVDDFSKCLLFIYKYSKNSIRYHTKILYEGIQRANIYDIIRVFTTRNEIDLKDITEDFENKYKISVDSKIIKQFYEANPETIDAIRMIMGII